MPKYEIDFDANFEELIKQVNKIEKAVGKLVKKKPFEGMKEEADTLTRKLTQLRKALNINMAAKGASLRELTRLSVDETEELGRVTKQTANEMKALDKDMTSMFDAKKKSDQLIDKLGNTTAQLADKTKKAGQSVSHFTKETKKFKPQGEAYAGVLNSWWQTFGRVAIGFTIAYRAMNAFEALLSKTSETIKQAILDAGELAALQAKLAMFANMASNGTITFEEGFADASAVVNGLADASIKSISSMKELSVAMDEVAQQGVIIPAKMTESFAYFVDYTLLVARTTGDSAKQLRSEITGLMDGQMRASNVLLRTMKNMGILSTKEIKDLRNMTNRAEIFNKVVEAIASNQKKVNRLMIEQDPTTGYAVWEKSIRRVLTVSIQLVSQLKETQNIFGEVFLKHIEKWNEEFSNIANNKDMGRFMVMMDKLAGALDIVLTAFERVVKAVAALFTAFDNLSGPIKIVLKYFLYTEVFFLAVKATKLLTAAIKALIVSQTIAIGKFALTAIKLGAIVIAAGLVIGTFYAIVTAIRVLIPSIKEFIQNIKDLIKDIAEFFSPVSKFFDKLHHKIKEILEATKKAGKDLRKQSEENHKGFKQQFEGNQPKPGFISKLIDKEPLQGAEDSIEHWRKVNEKAIEDLKADINSMFFIGPPKPTFADTFKETMKEDFAKIRAFIASVSEEAAQMFDKLFNPKYLPGSTSTDGKDSVIVNPVKELNLQLEKAEGNTKDLFTQLTKLVALDTDYDFDIGLTAAMTEVETKIKDLELDLKNAFASFKYALSKGLDDESNDLLVYIAKLQAELDELKKDLKDMPDTLKTAFNTQYLKDFKEKKEQIEFSNRYDPYAKAKEMRALMNEYNAKIAGYVPETKEGLKALTDMKKELSATATEATDFKSSIAGAFKSFAEYNPFEGFKDAVGDALGSMEDALIDFTDTGKMAWRDMIDAMMKDLLRLVIRMAILQPIAASITSGLSGLSFAEGGTISEHVVGVGLSSGRRYDIGEAGENEEVIPHSKLKGGKGDVTVNVYNAPSTPETNVSTDKQGNTRIDLMFDNMIGQSAVDGSLGKVLKNMYGLKPRLTGR